ncbi:hypothetical protein ABZP36_023811 [Zizania latifolia]
MAAIYGACRLILRRATQASTLSDWIRGEQRGGADLRQARRLADNAMNHGGDLRRLPTGSASISGMVDEDEMAEASRGPRWQMGTETAEARMTDGCGPRGTSQQNHPNLGWLVFVLELFCLWLIPPDVWCIPWHAGAW